VDNKQASTHVHRGFDLFINDEEEHADLGRLLFGDLLFHVLEEGLVVQTQTIQSAELQ
jgi:hypothetical protein